MSTSVNASPVGPAQGVPICGNGLLFTRSDAANSAKTFCKQLAKDGSWTTKPQSLKFSDVKIYDENGAVQSDKEFGLSINSNAAWCPKDVSLDTVAQTMTADRCVADIMTGIDGCGPFVAPKIRPFLKTVGLSYEDCIQWTIDINDS